MHSKFVVREIKGIVTVKCVDSNLLTAKETQVEIINSFIIIQPQAAQASKLSQFPC